MTETETVRENVEETSPEREVKTAPDADLDDEGTSVSDASEPGVATSNPSERSMYVPGS